MGYIGVIAGRKDDGHAELLRDPGIEAGFRLGPAAELHIPDAGLRKALGQRATPALAAGPMSDKKTCGDAVRGNTFHLAKGTRPTADDFRVRGQLIQQQSQSSSVCIGEKKARCTRNPCTLDGGDCFIRHPSPAIRKLESIDISRRPVGDGCRARWRDIYENTEAVCHNLRSP